MNHKHKLFLFFSLVVIFFVLWWYPKSKHIYRIKPRHNYIENMENMENQGEACCNNNPLFLAMKNSADISVLKEQVKELSQLREKVKVLETNNETNTKYLDTLQQEDVDVAKNIQDEMEETNERENNPESNSNTTIETNTSSTGIVKETPSFVDSTMD